MEKKLPSHLRTQRLLLRPLKVGDLDFFIKLHADRDVVRYLGGDGSPRTPEDTEAWLHRMLTWYEKDALGPYAITLESSGELLGRTGLSVFEIDKEVGSPGGVPIATWGIGSAESSSIESILELGYVVHPLAQQQGIATEGSRSWMKFAFEEWREPFLHSVIAGANVASLRVATKNGMEATHREIRMEGGLYGLYRRDRSSWV